LCEWHCRVFNSCDLRRLSEKESLFLLMSFINVNGVILKNDEAVIRLDDYSYRYGDGLFETMKMVNGVILKKELHFARLFRGISFLHYKLPGVITEIFLEQEIITLCKKNNCLGKSRIRLSVSPGHGGLYDNDDIFSYAIECSQLGESAGELNENGLVIDIFPSAKKSCDELSTLKTASHLVYAAAARHAKEKKLNDCLVLNVHERICDSTIANIFWIKDRKIFTPPLAEGCIAGVMREFLLKRMVNEEWRMEEKECSVTDIEEADEIFLTNAIREIEWIGGFRGKSYSNSTIKQLSSNLQQKF
jgi:branched-chain amino acid aminotransferase